MDLDAAPVEQPIVEETTASEPVAEEPAAESTEEGASFTPCPRSSTPPVRGRGVRYTGTRAIYDPHIKLKGPVPGAACPFPIHLPPSASQRRSCVRGLKDT
jgi:hypothetical protein